MDENEILGAENYDPQENNLDNKSVEENQIKINRQLMDLEEDQKINLKRRNSFESLSKDFSLIFPVKQEIIWNSCVSNFDFKQFEDRLALAKISTEKLPSELEKFKLKIINSILGQNGYFIDKKDLENIPVDDSFLCRVIGNCIDFPGMENFFNDQGNKITTLIKELSQWMEEQKLTIDNASALLRNYYTKIYDNINGGELKLDKPLLSLENLKKVMACINFKQNKNINLDDIYVFLQVICDLLYGQNENDIQKYITKMLNLLGYKIKGVENSDEAIFDEAIFDLNAQVNTSEFYKNAQNVETKLKFLEVIKVLGFELSLDDNNEDVFVLKQIDEVDRLIADIEYFHPDEINNWVKYVNTINDEDQNEIAADHYLTIDNSDSLVKMKQDSILSFIKNSENANNLQEKYKILLDKKNQDRLDTVILKKETVDWMIQNVDSESFEENEFDKVMNTVKKFYQYTDDLKRCDNPGVSFALISAFKSLTTDMVVEILSYCAKNIVINEPDFSLYQFARSLKVLKTKEQIPQVFIKLVKDVIDFENVNLYNDNEPEYFYDILYFLVEHSEKYNKDNPINAIQDVFGGQNKNYNDILNELSKIPNAQDFLNLSVMLKHNSQLASVLENNNLKISLANVAEENNIHDKQNANENNLKFKLEKMDDIDKFLIELSNCDDIDNINGWIQNFVAYWNKQDEDESESENEENKDENEENESKDIKNDYLEIKTFDDFKNMKKTCILDFIQKSKNAEKLKEKYKTLLDHKNQDRLDEIILDTKTVYYMLPNLPVDLLDADNFNELIEVIKKFLRYTDKPNKKLTFRMSLLLLGRFEECSLNVEKMKVIFELTDFSSCDNLNINFGLNIVSRAFNAVESIPSELFDLAINSIDWENINLYENSNYDMYQLCSIIICLVKESEMYDEGNPTAALDYVFVDKNATCRKFVDECLAKIPGYYDVLKNLKYMKVLGGDIEQLADMFEKVNYSLPCNYQYDQIDEMEISGEEKNHDYVCEQLDEISIYGKEIINDDNEQEVQIKFQENQKTNSTEIKSVLTQSNEGKKQTSSCKVTGVEILALIIAIACIITGSILSCYYIYLGLIVSCILLFFDSRSRKQKSTYENLKSGKITVPLTDSITNQQTQDQIRMNSNPNLITNKNNDIIEINGISNYKI